MTTNRHGRRRRQKRAKSTSAYHKMLRRLVGEPKACVFCLQLFTEFSFPNHFCEPVTSAGSNFRELAHQTENQEP